MKASISLQLIIKQLHAFNFQAWASRQWVPCHYFQVGTLDLPRDSAGRLGILQEAGEPNPVGRTSVWARETKGQKVLAFMTNLSLLMTYCGKTKPSG